MSLRHVLNAVTKAVSELVLCSRGEVEDYGVQTGVKGVYQVGLSHQVVTLDMNPTTHCRTQNAGFWWKPAEYPEPARWYAGASAGRCWAAKKGYRWSWHSRTSRSGMECRRGLGKSLNVQEEEYWAEILWNLHSIMIGNLELHYEDNTAVGKGQDPETTQANRV